MPTASSSTEPRRRRRTPLGKIRQARTLSQREVARLCEIAQQTYAKYETGKALPPADRREKIAAILGTTSDVLWPPGDWGLR